MANQANTENCIAENTHLDTNHLVVLFCNVQSLMSKMDELRLIALEKNPDLFGLVETWLDDSHGSEDFAINGYSSEYKNRDSNPNRGGVLVYIKSTIKYSTITVSTHPEICKCENIWLKLHKDNCNEKDVIVGITYRSHLNKSSDFLQHLCSDLEFIVSYNLPVVLMGDFNIDLLSGSQHGPTRNLVNTMSSFFFDQFIKEPTRVTA